MKSYIYILKDYVHILKNYVRVSKAFIIKQAFNEDVNLFVFR